MGLDPYLRNWFGRKGWDLSDKVIVDIGGGPVSMLTKTKAKERIVVDPCDYPNWIAIRYKEIGIKYIKKQAEKFLYNKIADEVWIYNCLQHVVNPQEIIKNLRSYAKLIRVFEWVNTGVEPGHPNNLTEQDLNIWFGGVGKVESINNSPVVGRAYFGIFKGQKYDQK
jgi:hypothetical protein